MGWLMRERRRARRKRNEGISGAEFGAVTRWATTPNPARLKLDAKPGASQAGGMLHVARTPDASGLALQRARQVDVPHCIGVAPIYLAARLREIPTLN
jgi:hypothetical protein